MAKMPFDTTIETLARKAGRKQPNRKTLRQLFVDTMKPSAEAYVTYWDTNLPGVSPKARKTWIAIYRVAGDPLKT